MLTTPRAARPTRDRRLLSARLSADGGARAGDRLTPECTERRFTNDLSGRVVVWMIAPFLLGAVVAGIQAGWTVGSGIAVAGLCLAAVMRTCRSAETLIIDETGLTRVIGRSPHRARTSSFSWDDVQATSYVERTVSAGANDHTLGVFTVQGTSGTLLEITQHWHSFAAIVAICNQRTPHLGYSWEPAQDAHAADVLERSGAYSRTARLTSQYSRLRREARDR